MKTTFGTFVREARLQKKIGLREFAIMMVDLSPAYISQMESGVCKPPMESKIIKIAEKLNINADYLLDLAGKISTENKEKLLKEILEKHQ
jgi:transcriptional regulator with XRE-family HTH domain